MKKCFAIVTLFLSGFAFSQQSPLHWNAVAEKRNDSTYIIHVKGSVDKSWHIYAANDASTGLEPLHLEWGNENIYKESYQANTVESNFTDPLFENKKIKIIDGNNFDFSETVKTKGPVPAQLNLKLKGFISDTKSFLPIDETRETRLAEGEITVNDPIKLAINLKLPASACGDTSDSNKANLFVIFFKGFAGGLLALLMPCLFPMIPLTVLFFTKKAGSRKEGLRLGASYGLSILLIYLLASLPFHLLKTIDPQIFNHIATNAWVNLVFFIIFVLFAISLFGFFEIRLPSSFSSKASAKTGIFFMALTLAIVSFSCTGPILGTLLVGSLSAQGNPWELTIGMGGFGLALALPFTLFAMFPQWLKSLPKSGGWLEVVKKSLAFIELAFAVKFLSNADLVEHWGILKREVFIGLWIIISVLLALYLFGVFDKIKLRRGYGRIGFGFLFLVFALYLLPGMTATKFANLKLLSGFPPPLDYSVYGKKPDNYRVEPNVINDYAKALQLSKQQHKPLLIDFTGWACVNCRKMEELVWTQPEVRNLIQQKYILVSLYVDDRKKLPAGEQFSYHDKDIQTVGDKWALFQSVNFGGASQPMYVVVSPEEKLMNLPVGYTEPEAYKEWLECGLNAYKK